MQKQKFTIYGMHCSSCEVLIHKEVSKVPGVKYLEVSHKTGILEVIYDGDLDKNKVEEAVCRCGYSTNETHGINETYEPKINHFALNQDNFISWLKAGSILVILFFLFTTLREQPFFKQATNLSKDNLSLPLAFMVGIIASVSTCLAVVGSVVMGLSSSFKNKKNGSFVPNLAFQAGRLSSFFVLGGILGIIGTSFRYSPTLSSILNITVAFVIGYLALSLLNIVPPMKSLLGSFSPSLGGKLAKLEGEGGYKSAFLMGGLTFFLPCGFTQSMQVLALSQADFFKSGLIMFAFALGTSPVLFGIGVLGTKATTLKDPAYAKVIAAILVFFALFNLNTGLALQGLSLPLPSFTSQVAATSGASSVTSVINVPSSKQTIDMEVNNAGYTPQAFTIKKGIPVEWRINATALNGCNGTLIVPSLGIQKSFSPGLNTITFTPTQTGRINFSCGMGMIRGYFDVVENSGQGQQAVTTGAIPQAQVDPKAAGAGSCGGSGGCGCGGTRALP